VTRSLGRAARAGVLVALVTAVAARRVTRRRARAAAVRAEHVLRAGRPSPPGDVRLSVVVPAYREGDRIAAAVKAIRAELQDLDGGLEIVVVDDGSRDDTAAAARDSGADQVITLPGNRGKGAAVRAGVLAANGRTVAFTDADLAYGPDQLICFLETIESGWDVAVGSRKHEGATALVRARRLREIGGRVINLFTHVVLLGNYRDTQCGLKAFRADVASELFDRARIDGFAFDIELFVMVERNGLALTEVPVAVRNTRASTVRVVRDAARLMRDVLRIRRWARQGVYEVAGLRNS